MKILLISLLINLISISVYADDIFPDRGLNDIQVTMISADAERAWIQDAEGTEAEILIGDTIGAEKGIVVKIERASITIRRGKTMTMIPVIYGFE
ncbi:MAG TPA: hypothetical protein ENH40_02690 [Nitrospirae bacterium]|nr:hypothetical protein [Nitrospirota bacterium]